MADTKNLCAQIPIDLHRQVREHQEESGKSLGEYMTWLITTFYQTEVEKQMSSTESRTVGIPGAGRPVRAIQGLSGSTSCQAESILPGLHPAGAGG